MVKFGKNKFKALNKIAKKQNAGNNSVSNKVIKKKLNAEKKVSFQKEVLVREAATESDLVKNVTAKDILSTLCEKREKKAKPHTQETKKKPKSVQKHKKRQKTQINDTKLLLKLMNKKKIK